MPRWTELWLNEGFASFVEHLSVENQYPEWQIWNQVIFPYEIFLLMGVDEFFYVFLAVCGWLFLQRHETGRSEKVFVAHFSIWSSSNQSINQSINRCNEMLVFSPFGLWQLASYWSARRTSRWSGGDFRRHFLWKRRIRHPNVVWFPRGGGEKWRPHRPAVRSVFSKKSKKFFFFFFVRASNRACQSTSRSLNTKTQPPWICGITLKRPPESPCPPSWATGLARRGAK